MAECDKTKIGCNVPYKPVGRSRFSINSDGKISYGQDYTIDDPNDAVNFLGDSSPEFSRAIAVSVAGKQDSCGQWIASVTYETQDGEVPIEEPPEPPEEPPPPPPTPPTSCPADEIVVTGSAIESSWQDHECFHKNVSGQPFNGKKPSCFWGWTRRSLGQTAAANGGDCGFTGDANPITDKELDQYHAGFNIKSFLSEGAIGNGPYIFAGSTTYLEGSYQVSVTEYFTNDPPSIGTEIGFPAQPPGFPVSSGQYGMVISGAEYKAGQGHPCGRRVLQYQMSAQPWAVINPNDCSVVGPY